MNRMINFTGKYIQASELKKKFSRRKYSLIFFCIVICTIFPLTFIHAKNAELVVGDHINFSGIAE